MVRGFWSGFGQASVLDDTAGAPFIGAMPYRWARVRVAPAVARSRAGYTLVYKKVVEQQALISLVSVNAKAH